MTWFVDNPTAVEPVICGNRSRAVGAGVDPFQYDEITNGLTSLRQWLPAFAAAAIVHQQDAQAAEDLGRSVTATTSWRSTAVCWHVATTMPNPDMPALRRASVAASTALSRYLHLRGNATPLAGGDAGLRYVGELRRPGDAQRPPVVVILPGLDSSRTEFLDLTEALLARGLAVAAIDGPGQGALLDQPPTPHYHLVTSGLLDELQQDATIDSDRIAVVGLSLGGLYAQLASAHDRRITAVATVSGPSLPTWDLLPPFATDTLEARAEANAVGLNSGQQTIGWSGRAHVQRIRSCSASISRPPPSRRRTSILRTYPRVRWPNPV